MDEALGYLVGAIFITVLVVMVIIAILYIGVILLGVVAGVGALLGFVVAAKNFYLVVMEAHTEVSR